MRGNGGRNARLVREGKLFSPFDLIVYALLLVLVTVLFVLFVFGDVFHAKDADGVRVQVNGEQVYSYVFGEGGRIEKGWEDRVETRTEGEMLYVRIGTADGWNELAIDLTAGTVRMADADCSLRKDCTHMQAIGAGGTVITCIPHALKVTPLTEDLSSPSIG